ncbi:MAG TPA: TetR/AcrR family transcriptional regulator [Solirubrobacteraceae bacterium]|jgi:AcrR family transcriptional regulator|nr:TetR/AcrR family transcriptional regulator [Solirubrobacteraceae bacterium]
MPRAEREEEMLEAAGQAFAHAGYHEASMDAIAEAAGISKPMLYNYFGSKQGLYVAYIERSGRALLTGMREADSRGAPAAQRLHAGILAFLTYAEEHSAGWTILHRETLAQGGLVAKELSGLRARVTQMLTALFEDEAFAHAFAGAGESLASWWLAHPEQPKEQIAKILMEIARSAPAPPEQPLG